MADYNERKKVLRALLRERMATGKGLRLFGIDQATVDEMWEEDLIASGKDGNGFMMYELTNNGVERAQEVRAKQDEYNQRHQAKKGKETVKPAKNQSDAMARNLGTHEPAPTSADIQQIMAEEWVDNHIAEPVKMVIGGSVDPTLQMRERDGEELLIHTDEPIIRRHESDCDQRCLNCEVLELLLERQPEVSKLYEAVRQRREHEASINRILQTLGGAK